MTCPETVCVSRWVRARQKKRGLARVQYLRFARFFVILATHGQSPFFADEAGGIKDIRETPITFHGYSIGCRHGWGDTKWHPSVRIASDTYRRLRRRFEAMAVRCAPVHLRAAFRRLPFEPWAPVRRQLWGLAHAVNRHRKQAGLEPVPDFGLLQRQRPIRPFRDLAPGEGEAGLSGQPLLVGGAPAVATGPEPVPAVDLP